MSSTGHKLSVTMPVTGVNHCEDDSEWVCCLGCGQQLGLTQPELVEPARLIGTCEKCGRWYLLDWNPNFRKGLMLLLPDHADLLESFASYLKTLPETEANDGKLPPSCPQ